MPRNLWIFIDAMPHDVADQTKFMADVCPIRCKVTPGFGYSINIQAEMFCGLTPDAAGYFNEWGFNPGGGYLRRLRLPKLLYNNRRRLRGRVVDRGMHVILRNLGSTVAEQNVPFDYQHMFSRKQRSPYGYFPPTPFFKDRQDIYVSASEIIAEPPGRRDVVSFERAALQIGVAPNIFVTLCDLDHFGHEYGVGTPEYLQRVKDLESWIGQLAERFLAHDREGRISVFSDHGMANIRESVTPEIEAALGEAGSETYAYFLDSSMLRFWAVNQSYLEPARRFLEDLDCGVVVTEADRTEFGLTSRDFGDLILVLNEESVFAPNFLGNAVPKAMHGYHPRAPGQQTVFLTNYELPTPVNRTLDYHHVLNAD